MAVEDITLSFHKNDLAGAVGWVVAAAGGLWFGFRRLMRITGADKLSSSGSDAQVDIIKLLRDQVDRLSLQNEKLTAAVRELQLEVFQLRDENALLRRHLGLPTDVVTPRVWTSPIPPAPAS